MKELKFSLVLCTVGKTKDLEEFLICLKNQDYKRFQLIIVDQNDDNRVDKIISSYCKSMDILHVKSEKGLSKARNVGIGFCDGDIVAFPDDDCIYPTTMLAEINAFFNKEHYDILSIKMTNNVPSGRKIQEGIESQQVTRKNVLKLMASISMFYKVHVIESVGSFDENLGLGAKTIYQGGEDYDYPLRALKKDYNIFFDNTIHVLHPWDDKEIELNRI